MLHHRGPQQELLGVGLPGSRTPRRAGSRRSRAGRRARPPATRRPAGRGRRRRARYSPVAQPSVARSRASRSSIASETSSRPRSSSVSVRSNESSGPPNAARAPAARRRASGSGGSTRVATAIWPPVGRQSSSVSTISPAVGIDDVLGVVEHEQERWRRRHGRRQSGHDALPHRRHRHVEHLAQRRVESRHVAQRGRQVDEQQDGVVVGRIEAQPGDGPALAGHPLQQGRRLARAGGRREQHERSVATSQSVEQHAAWHEADVSPRRPQLGRQRRDDRLGMGLRPRRAPGGRSRCASHLLAVPVPHGSPEAPAAGLAYPSPPELTTALPTSLARFGPSVQRWSIGAGAAAPRPAPTGA